MWPVSALVHARRAQAFCTDIMKTAGVDKGDLGYLKAEADLSERISVAVHARGSNPHADPIGQLPDSPHGLLDGCALLHRPPTALTTTRQRARRLLAPSGVAAADSALRFDRTGTRLEPESLERQVSSHHPHEIWPSMGPHHPSADARLSSTLC